MFGFNRITGKKKIKKVNNISTSQSNIKKDKVDNFTVALYMMRNEKDPIKRTKMNMRLSQGIYDFSDLK